MTTPTIASSLVPRPSSLGSPSPGSASLSHIASRINQALQAADLSQDATTTLSKRSVSVQVLADKAYFANDSATLGATGDRVVDTIAGVVRTLSNDVRVEGFTDNTPIVGGPFTSNWELSAVRAVNVVQRLQTHDGIAGGRLSAIGYGTTRPVVPNTTPANRAENRRIDVVILTATQAFPAGGAGTSPPVAPPVATTVRAPLGTQALQRWRRQRARSLSRDLAPPGDGTFGDPGHR